jgi:hypothetical protein
MPDSPALSDNIRDSECCTKENLTKTGLTDHPGKKGITGPFCNFDYNKTDQS